MRHKKISKKQNEDFRELYKQEEIYAEKRINRISIGLASTFILVALSLSLLTKSSMGDPNVVSNIIGLLIYLIYSFVILLILKKNKYHPVIKYFTVFCTVSIITTIVAGYSVGVDFVHSTRTITISAYFLAIITSGLYQNPKLSLYAGVMASIQYTLLFLTAAFSGFPIQAKMETFQENIITYDILAVYIIFFSCSGILMSLITSRHKILMTELRESSLKLNKEKEERKLSVKKGKEERQFVEKKLHESEDKFRALFELSPVGMIMLDFESNTFLEVNNSALKSIGYSKEEFLQLDISDILPDEYGDLRIKQRENLNNHGKFGPYEIEFYKKDGSRYPIRTSGFLMNNIDGMNVVWGIIEDITESKLAEEKLAQSQKLKSIGQLAGGMAHDFNNVLNAIISSAELLQNSQSQLDKSGIKFVDIILNSSARAKDLIKKLLAFGRRGTSISQSIDVHEVLDETYDILQRTIDKRIMLYLHKNAQSATVIGDYSGIVNVIINLAINASHAMPDGGSIEITTENIILDSSYCDKNVFDLVPGQYIDILVKDDGSGIAPDSLPRIFEPFFTTKEQGKGTGLGLAAAYGTIQDHHGEINVHSELGAGTSFHILLPISEQKVMPRIERTKKIAGQGTVLLVDDEEANRDLGKIILDSLGYDVLLAENGLESVEIFAEKYKEIDLVLMDMVMPYMNGSEAFYRMKEIDKNCKVIIVSGHIKSEMADEMADSGLLGVIHKPYTISEISKQVSDALSS